MHLRDEGLDPAVQDFRKTGMLRDILDCQTRFTKGLCRASRRKQFRTVGGKRTPQFDQSRLVRNGEEGATDGESGLSHDENEISFKTCPRNRE